jgi:hypothetical protein
MPHTFRPTESTVPLTVRNTTTQSSALPQNSSEKADSLSTSAIFRIQETHLPPDHLVPDPIIAREFSVTLMTLWRWSHDSILDFPPAAKIRGKNFRSRRAIEEFKVRMLRGAIRAGSERSDVT